MHLKVFQNLYVGTEDPYFNVGDTGVDGNVFGLASPQKKMVTTYDEESGSTGGFPVTVDNIGLVGGPMKPGLKFTTKINLVDQIGFSADFTLAIYGKLTLPGESSDGRFGFAYDGIGRPIILNVEVDDFKGFALDGTLRFYDRRDSGGGKGVSGDLEVSMPIGLTVAMQADFGRTGPSHEDGEFSYWYINGLVTFSGGIDLFSGFALYGFGGGVYHHLADVESSFPSKKEDMIPSDTDGGDGAENPDSLASEGAVHDLSPTKSTFLGLKLKAVMGLKGEPKSFNMNVEFEVTIPEGGGGIGTISINGDGYVMRDIQETEGTGKVWANIEMDLVLRDPEGTDKKFFSGDFRIFVKVDNDFFYLRGPTRAEKRDALIERAAETGEPPGEVPPDFENYQFTRVAFYADNKGIEYKRIY